MCVIVITIEFKCSSVLFLILNSHRHHIHNALYICLLAQF